MMKINIIDPEQARPDWTKRCLNCGAAPILPITGLCGPCTFGEADMSGGAWWDENPAAKEKP